MCCVMLNNQSPYKHCANIYKICFKVFLFSGDIFDNIKNRPLIVFFFLKYCGYEWMTLLPMCRKLILEWVYDVIWYVNELFLGGKMR